MRFLDFLRRGKPNGSEAKGVFGFTLPQIIGGASINPAQSYRTLSSEGFIKNAVAYRCVTEIASTCASVKLIVKSKGKGEPIDNHPLEALLDRPNPMRSYGEFMFSYYAYLLLSGNAYMLGISTGSPSKLKLSELNLLRPDRIIIKGEEKIIPKAYEYNVDGETVVTYPIDKITGRSDVKHSRLFHPLSDHYGLSPITAAYTEIINHSKISAHSIASLENGAMPAGAFAYVPSDASGKPADLTSDQRDQLQDLLARRFRNNSMTNIPLVLDGDFKWLQMGLSARDMEYINGKNVSARDIAMAFNVPPQIIGLPDSQTYSNYQEARLAFSQDTCMPLMKRVESDLNEYFAYFYGDVMVEYDYDSIPALQDARRKTYESILAMLEKKAITINEARELMREQGLNIAGDLDGGDDIYMPSNQFPLSEGAIDDDDVPAPDPDDDPDDPPTPPPEE